jgi:hypothetical protein
LPPHERCRENLNDACGATVTDGQATHFIVHEGALAPWTALRVPQCAGIALALRFATPPAPYRADCAAVLPRHREEGRGSRRRERVPLARRRDIPRDWYSTQEVARILGKRPFTVREWHRLGRKA